MNKRGPVKPTKPEYQTRGNLVEIIADALGESKNVDIKKDIYNKIGAAFRNKTLLSEPIGGGRIKQISPKECIRYAKEVYGVDISSKFKPNLSNAIKVNGNEDLMDSVIDDIKDVLKLHNKHLLDAEYALEMIKKVFVHKNITY